MRAFEKLCLPLLASLALGLGYLGGTVRAQSDQFPPQAGTVSNIPVPDGNAYGTSLRYDSNGNLYAWDGFKVWESSGGTRTFTNIGSAASPTSGTNSADAGPITLSQNGQTLLLGNGYGGMLGGAYDGVFYTVPAAGGLATQVTGSGVPATGDALALPAGSGISNSSTKYLVDAGTDSGSVLSIYDTVTGSNQVVVSGIPGASTSIAYNPTNHSVYVGDGYDYGGGTTGDIRGFSLSLIASAYSSQNPILYSSAPSFDSAGTGYQTGAGMFFDSNGYLFSGGGPFGGPDGITVFAPNGTIVRNILTGADDNPLYDTVTYDPANNQVLVVPYGSSTGTLYNASDFETVPEPSTFVLLAAGAVVGLVAWRRRRS